MASIAGVSAGTAVAVLTLDSSPFTAGLKSAKEHLQTFCDSNDTAQSRINALGSAVNAVGITMTKGLTIPILGAGAAAVKTTADFDGSMSRVRAISGAVGEDFNKLRKQAIDLGASTSFSAKDNWHTTRKLVA